MFGKYLNLAYETHHKTWIAPNVHEGGERWKVSILNGLNNAVIFGTKRSAIQFVKYCSMSCPVICEKLAR